MNRFKSTSQLSDEMTTAVAAAKKAHAEAAHQSRVANALLKEIKSRKVAVVEYIDVSNFALGTAEVQTYRADGSTCFDKDQHP